MAMDRLGRTWRLRVGATLVVFLAVMAALGFVIVPVIEGRQTGLDPFTAICRAFGIGTPGTAAAVTAPARPETRVAWTAPTLAALAATDKAAGATAAEAACVACHAADGTSPDPAVPHMAGQSAYAIFKELRDYKDGARVNDTMSPIAQSLDDKEIADVAAYYASLKPTGLDASHPSLAGPEIEAIALRGDPSRTLPPCAACHAAGVGGPLETPVLTGQSPAYIESQLQAFAKGERHNDTFMGMRAIAAKLTPREMALLGTYYTTPH
ncbi:MAG: c-type cytochrome [Alphaproteobacteria bacterium]